MNTLCNNLILNTDSYKLSHVYQYPERTQTLFGYGESRGGAFEDVLFFGLQAIIQEQLAHPVTEAMIEEARELVPAHGFKFYEEGWRRLLEKHEGRLPIRIRAVREGTVVPQHQLLWSVESTDPEFFWLVSYVETLLMRVWYPTTVASLSYHCKKILRAGLEQSSETPEAQLPFKLHDFGARGVSSQESAMFGGMGHLVNFMGTDTLDALRAARYFYDAKGVVGYSIPAAEHSTTSIRGRAAEVETYRHMIKTFGQKDKIFAVVSDTYDIFNAIENLWGKELRQEVIDSGATLVIRPDSGEPVEVVAKCLALMDQQFGSVVNAKGYKVINHVRLIQGDGINPNSLKAIVDRVLSDGYSLDNIAFGMGGGLLQQVNRDTLKFAMKLSAAEVDGEWRDVYKDPITDPGKRSKRGRLTLTRHGETGEYRTLRLEELKDHPEFEDVLCTVFENGVCFNRQTFEEIRLRSETA